MEKPTKIPLSEIANPEKVTTVSNRQKLEAMTDRYIELKKFFRHFQWFFLIFSLANCAQTVACVLLGKSLMQTNALYSAGAFMIAGVAFAGNIYLLILVWWKTDR
jgi:hypothetical protein